MTNVLFVSKENAARSLLAEACLSHLGKERFRAFSCGRPSAISDAPSPWAIMALNNAGISPEGLRCKSWTEFTRSGTPMMDFVISLDEASWDAQPIWLGQPETALWAYPPLKAKRKEPAQLGIKTLHTLHSLRQRVELLVNLHSKLTKRSELSHDLRDLAFL